MTFDSYLKSIKPTALEHLDAAANRLSRPDSEWGRKGPTQRKYDTDHIIQATSVFYTIPDIFISTLLLQNAPHNNHLLRTKFPNKCPKSIHIARCALTKKRRDMSAKVNL